ncbi:hypothetical protein MANES_15G188210v8 [Manihot esculenta]|uniref:Uncharacterized protein n=1 Tax=Manihot esculenta TaxID=3983 RepID=A0ACB7GD02_MANES|nr:hypothetical protein MANES_15G188210v8 [Manihot esculenta]
MVYLKSQAWIQWLPMAEWWYNSTLHSALKMSLFQTLYGYPPFSFPMELPIDIIVDNVDQFLHDRQKLGQLLKENLDGKVAYKLEEPPESSIHPVFHVYLLTKKVGESPIISTVLPNLRDDTFVVASEKVLRTRTVLRSTDYVIQGLIKWVNLSLEDATREDKTFIETQFPTHCLS